MCGSGIIKQLGAFSKLSSNSPFILNNGVDLLYKIFLAPKPILKSTEEKTTACKLLKASLENLDSSLRKFSGSLNVDKRQTAQQVRSGLQFLTDELIESVSTLSETDQEIKSIENWDSVKSIEDYISNTIGIEPEHVSPAPQDLSVIPLSHVWWFQEESEDED